MKFPSTTYQLLATWAVLSVTIHAQPNIIIMQPDDLSFYDDWSAPPNNPSQPRKSVDIPSDGLPNMERLRNNGLHMLQAYTVSPKCGTSRYSTITGKYPSRAASSRETNTKNNEDIAEVTIPTTKLEDYDSQNDCTEENLAVAFKNNGYRTGMIGKWHLSSINLNNSYDYSEAQETVKGCGFDYVEGLFVENLSEEGGFNLYSDGTFSHNMEWITVEAINFIQQDADQPFFLYFNPTVPHSSNDVKTAITDFSCTAVANGTLDNDPMIEGMTLEYGNCEDYRAALVNRAASDDELGPMWVDDSIGALITALENQNALDNTIFLFQQDHGMETKSALFENGNRIAQFIHYPNEISAGSTLDAPVATIDIGPTMLDFAGITVPYSMDGISWRGALTDSTFESYLMNDRCLFFEIDKDRAVRCGCDKYLQLYSLDTSESTTYQRGIQYDYELANDNVYDLCGGTSAYVTEKSTSMEETNQYSADSETDTTLADRMSCHLARTDYTLDPDYSDCSLNPAPTANPNASPTAAPQASPTVAPQASPTTSSTCNDSILRFKLPWNGKNISRYCSWVANKQTATRCAVEGVSAMCPDTCDTCSTCVDSDVRFKFSWNGSTITRSCTWTANKQTETRCTSVEGMTDSCRSTCGQC